MPYCSNKFTTSSVDIFFALAYYSMQNDTNTALLSVFIIILLSVAQPHIVDFT